MIQQDTMLLLFSDEVVVEGFKTALSLSRDGMLRWYDSGNVLHSLSVEKHVLGVSTIGQHMIVVKSFVKDDDGFCFGRSCFVRKTFVFEPFSGDSFRILFHNLQSCLHSLGRPKRLFIFVNPFGGKKSASKVFANDVRPILEDANMEYSLQETRYQLHAKEVSHTLDLTEFDGIICVSGDGILVEVVNGLLEREDWQAALKMPIGVIPAGTGNGMIKSLLDSVGQPCTAAYAMVAAVRGHKRSLDVATIWQGETRFFSVLMLAWGLIADIDIESEKYRWMGSARMDIYLYLATTYVGSPTKLRKYNGCISFVPAPGFEDAGEPISLGIVESIEPRKARQHSYQDPKVDFPSSCWRKLNGPFIGVWLQNVPWGSETAKAAPNAKFDDGYLDLILMRECPKLALLSLMSEMSNGNYVRSPHLLYIKVKAVILEPGSRTCDSTKEGIIDSDGEVLARGKGTYKCHLKSLMVYDKMQILVDRGLATLFTPI